MKIYTIGHSTRSIDEFVKMLQAHRIELVVDVRSIPKSRHNPQFNGVELKAGLAEHDLECLRLDKLGGLRHTRKDSVNKGWKNASFRGYADYMQTPEFEQGIQELLEVAKTKRVAIMCAEAVPWRCHRSLIGDALLVGGVEVKDIMSQTASKPHQLTLFAKVKGQKITYPEDKAG